MKRIATFLRERPLRWIAPIVLVFGGLAWLAWKTVQVPALPFTYRVDFP